MTLAEKILARHVKGAQGPVYVRPGDALMLRVTITKTNRSQSKPDRGIVKVMLIIQFYNIN